MTDPMRAARHAIVQASINLANGDTVSAHGDIEQALAALAADTARPDPRHDMVEFLGWLFRDGGLEPPRREYEEVEEALAALVWKHGADTARPGLDVEALRHAAKNVERRNDRALNFWRDIDTVAAEYARLTEARP